MARTAPAGHLELAIHHHVKDELGDSVARSAHDHDGLLSANLQFSVVSRWHIGEATEACSRTENLVHPLWARSVDQCGTLRHFHELFPVNGILGLRRQRHVKCHTHW